MSEETTQAPNNPRRSRLKRNKLRKAQEIDHVTVEEVFPLLDPTESSDDRKVGEACYVSALVHNKRYYGLLVDQESLKVASNFCLQEQAASLGLNRRMQVLQQQIRRYNGNVNEDSTEENARKRARVDQPEGVISTSSEVTTEPPGEDQRQVQKFRYTESTAESSDYRILLATYANLHAAALDDPERAKAIEAVCISGGGFVGDYYYQFEVQGKTLTAPNPPDVETCDDVHTSLGFHSFLKTINLPRWFPLASLEGGQNKLLNTLNLKVDNKGSILRENLSVTDAPVESAIPMEPRLRYRIAVVGGGIAGLSCCLELLRQSDREGIDLEVVLIEGRSRLGGRLVTDQSTFKHPDGSVFPIDLGASWINGIDMNPLAKLAREAGVDFVTTSEDVKMLREGMQEIDPEKDERAGDFFEQLLDCAAENCWANEEEIEEEVTVLARQQPAIRWYASALTETARAASFEVGRPPRTVVPDHRPASDLSVDAAVGHAIARKKLSEFTKLTEDERRVLYWYMKNVEYAVGANTRDLSMKFWDVEEQHAFEGSHVLLKQGYSTIVDHLKTQLETFRAKFHLNLDFPVGMIEYGRKTTSHPCIASFSPQRRLVELSDICKVTSRDGRKNVRCDFVVCAVPLGVLKNSLESSDFTKENALVFDPDLPFSKRDAIQCVGFGLLNKVFIQFPRAFWRGLAIHGNQVSFGNASSQHPHHYLFFDVSKSLGCSEDSPAILMSLISGIEAVVCEQLNEDEVVKQVMETLRAIFSGIEIPDPVETIVTRWGSDEFSRGSHTYLPPGTTDQDFQSLQSPINANGDSLLLEGSEIMRVFFAGEHTTSLHPSTAHGAMLSGIRAAKEVLASISFSLNNDDDVDRLIPVSLFQYLNPTASAECILCHLKGTRIREGTLLAFKRGARQILVHNNCAEFSPEVEVEDGQWSNVVRACNRGKSIPCSLCHLNGATIKCLGDNCSSYYHYSCGEDTGWRFETDGKDFLCDFHRPDFEECRKLSLSYFKSRNASLSRMLCSFCGRDKNPKLGEMLVFQFGKRFATVHELCIGHTTIIKVSEDSSSKFDNDFKDVFLAIDEATTKHCIQCSQGGANIICSSFDCNTCYHVPCAMEVGWNPEKRTHDFKCSAHQKHDSARLRTIAKIPGNVQDRAGFYHANFSKAPLESENSISTNWEVGRLEKRQKLFYEFGQCSDESDDDYATVDLRPGKIVEDESSKLTDNFESGPFVERLLVRITRRSLENFWEIELEAKSIEGSDKCILVVSDTNEMSSFDKLEKEDIIIAINGVRIGSAEYDSVAKVLARLDQEVDLMVEVERELN